MNAHASLKAQEARKQTSGSALEKWRAISRSLNLAEEKDDPIKSQNSQDRPRIAMSIFLTLVNPVLTSLTLSLLCAALRHWNMESATLEMMIRISALRLWPVNRAAACM